MASQSQFKPRSQPPVSVVTGAAGFLGSHRPDRLLARGYKVIGIDNFVTGRVNHIAYFRTKV